jgi:hypothetical protein
LHHLPGSKDFSQAHTETSTDPIAACRFNDLLAGYGFVGHVSMTTHKHGHALNTVATRVDLPPPTVEVLDVGRSDHRLLRWSAPLARPAPV